MVATSNLYQCSSIDGVDTCCSSALPWFCGDQYHQVAGIASHDGWHRDRRFFISPTERLRCALITY